jgi:hypothetical protein
MPCASSRELRSPAEFLQTVTRSFACASELLPWGLGPIRDINTRSPRPSGIPSPTGSVRSVSHALDGLLLPVPCAFVSPRCRVQGFAPRVCFLRPSRTTSSVALTLAPLAAFACRLPGASERRVDLKVVLSSRVRGVRRGCSPRRHPCPFLRFFRLPRAFHEDLGRAIARPPLAVLMVRCCVCPVP